MKIYKILFMIYEILITLFLGGIVVQLMIAKDFLITLIFLLFLAVWWFSYFLLQKNHKWAFPISFFAIAICLPPLIKEMVWRIGYVYNNGIQGISGCGTPRLIFMVLIFETVIFLAFLLLLIKGIFVYSRNRKNSNFSSDL